MKTTILTRKPVSVSDNRDLEPIDVSEMMWFDSKPLSDEESAEMDREFLEGGLEARAKREAELIARGYAVTPGPVEWVSPLEDWLSCLLGWGHPACSDDSIEPINARRIALTLDLPGGSAKDAVKVTVETTTHKTIHRFGKETWCEHIDTITLMVYADGKFYSGIAEYTSISEMGYTLVALRNDPPPEVGDRVLSVLIGIEGYAKDWPAPLYAALKPLNKCQACGRKLDDPVSRVLQLGPTCASHIGLPHNQAVVEAVMRYRKAQSPNAT